MIIETSKTMKGKATMALVLSLVLGIIISYGVMTPTARVFATAIGEHQPLWKSNWRSTSTTGIIMALDSDTGKILWQFNVGYKIDVGGPSIGHGMLLVPTKGENIGSLIPFGLP
jgi:hypothetical protein